MRIRRALISVSNKTGLEALATALAAAGAQIYSTGGTAAFLREHKIACADVTELTGGDGELLGGRVKTLHSRLHAGLLANPEDPEHARQLQAAAAQKIDLLVVNFYPFVRATAGGDAAEIIENIDIGGPAMARAAAKNHAHTAVVTDPADYPLFIAALKNGGINAETRRQLAAKAFVAVAALDAAIANYFSAEEDSAHPPHRFLHLQKIADLRYGENPHQSAACYGAGNGFGNGGGGLPQLQGAPVSYNNLLDGRAACLAARLHARPAAAVVKHNNPCGVAVGETAAEALGRAIAADEMSAFGGVVAVNRPLDGAAAATLKKGFWEAIIAPQFDSAAKAALAEAGKTRLLLSAFFEEGAQTFAGDMRMMLAQTVDSVLPPAEECASQRAPDAREQEDLRFAWRVAACVKSNAVVVAKNGATVGIGGGQMSRVDAAWLACEKARRGGKKTRGAVAASDGFFPFADGVEALAAAGVSAVIQPGGGKKDAEIVACANRHNMAMVFSSRRHFRH